MEALVRQPCVASTSGRTIASTQWPSWASSSSRGRPVCRGAARDFTLWQSAELPKGFKSPTVVPGERTLATPRLSNERAFQRLIEAVHPRAGTDFGAFYSSILGGIVVQPGLMVVHADDHMVHRGHGVYDVVALVGGTLYQLDEHVARLTAAADAAGIPMPMGAAAIKRVLLDTAAASLKLNGHVQFWATPGRGGLGLSTDECFEPALYALATSEYANPSVLGRSDGWRAALSPVEPPPAYFGAFKSASYLQQAVAQMEVEGRGYNVPLFVDEDGHVVGAPTASLAIITQDLRFVYAPFDSAPRGITVQTLAQLIPENTDADDLPLTGVEQRPISVDDVRGALEAMLVSTKLGVMPLTHLDEQPIADGAAGALSMALQTVLDNDREPREGSAWHVPVPYGGITGMRSQLT